ncbi:MAG TPA: response regulator [Candidatus Dormibacteraeota bacterium]|nr:response regulator [Candidatus Dormibacteraeota bacterium]
MRRSPRSLGCATGAAVARVRHSARTSAPMSRMMTMRPSPRIVAPEMPRMDGYEVAAHVRNDPRLKDVPIIMVTSRVGEKHRARAIELGVDDYLGKPYQEAQLLDAIAPLVERRRAAVRQTASAS